MSSATRKKACSCRRKGSVYLITVSWSKMAQSQRRAHPFYTPAQHVCLEDLFWLGCLMQQGCPRECKLSIKELT